MSKIIDFRTEKDKLYLNQQENTRFITCIFVLTKDDIDRIKRYKKRYGIEDINYALRDLIGNAGCLLDRFYQ